ncbi:protein transport protein Bet1p [[Candida] railenensis]|uniref:Protein transport protein Bet1p n=1 Tax=[Candida] railenensis TaxID=45579 RepID=A0A9P0VXF6_9ASCO|nr:protein transport protein Bet1p [[Candida] railenensis]
MSSRYSNAGGAHQRDLRTQLFAAPPRGINPTPPSRSESPYDNATPSNSAKYNESYLSSLESQNNDELDTMGAKVRLLKDLGVRMGGEINKSIKLNDEITDSMEKGKLQLRKTWNRMIDMSQRAGITWRMWLVVFALVGIWFFWVWIT